MAERCRQAGTLFLVNDRADAAVLAGAAGVHVGQEDLPVDAVRRIVGDAIVGVSTHSTVQVRTAMQTSADYLAIGPVFDTATKGSGVDPTVGLAGVSAAVREMGDDTRKVVAIGGVTIDNAPSVLGAGAASVAVISDLLVPEWRTRAADYLRVLRAV